MPVKEIPVPNQAVTNLGYDYESQPKSFVEKCNLCSGAVWVTISHTDRYGYRASATACRNCGLTILNPVMNMDAYGTFYMEIYRPLLTAHFGKPYDEQAIQRLQIPYAHDRVNFLRPYFSRLLKGKRMLDIGGSTGVVAEVLKDAFGLQATILDPAPLEIEEARKRGLSTVTGFIENYVVRPEERYDFIGMFQTVDHLLDVAGTFQKVRDAMTPDGLFYVDIVDFRAAYLRNSSVERAIKIDHPYYFTEHTIEMYLDRFGFETVAMEYSADKLHVGYLCRKSTGGAALTVDRGRVQEFFAEVRLVQNG